MKTLRRLVLTAVLGAGALTSVAWGKTDSPPNFGAGNEYREHNNWRKHERREHRREERRERRGRKERRQHERRERHWHNYDWR
jgi:hypothetical protein